jgi:hypothetical protein
MLDSTTSCGKGMYVRTFPVTAFAPQHDVNRPGILRVGK